MSFLISEASPAFLGWKYMSRGQVICLAQPDSTAVVEGTGTSDVLLLLKTVLSLFAEVEDEG